MTIIKDSVHTVIDIESWCGEKKIVVKQTMDDGSVVRNYYTADIAEKVGTIMVETAKVLRKMEALANEQH